jgi:hypothetical protein
MITNKNISLKTIVSQKEGNIVSNMGGEKVMLSVQNGKYYNLGEIGGVIWDKIEKPLTINQLVLALTAEYDVNQSECEEQVLSFLEKLVTEGLVEVNG